MSISADKISEKIDALIRVFFYIMVFWLPYSPAVIESCVITAVVLWIVKRLVINWSSLKQDGKDILKCFIPPSNNLNQPIYYFLIICIISIASSIFWQGAFADLITKILEWFAILWLIQESFKNRQQLILLLAILIFSASVTAVDAILQYHVFGQDILRGVSLSPDHRATAAFKTPGSLGALMATTIPLTLAAIFYTNKRMVKAVLFPVLGIMVYALVLTFTRGAWFGCFVGILIFLFTFLVWFRNFEAAKTILLAIIFLVLTAVFPLMLNTQTTLNLIKRSNTISWRIYIWKDSWQMIKDRPFFGHGVNTYMPIFQSYRRDPTNYPTYAHNCYIQLATEVGLLGLGAFCWILVKFFTDGFNRLKSIERESKNIVVLAIGMLSAVGAFLVHAFFDTNFYSLQLSALLWLYIGIQSKINQLKTERI